MRQLAAAIALSALALAAVFGLIGPAGAADMPGYHGDAGKHSYAKCGAPQEEVTLYKKREGFPTYWIPTTPGRTPYYTCVTGTVLVPGDIPPPPEYCCG